MTMIVVVVVRSIERGVQVGTSGTKPGFFRGARNFGNFACYIYTKMKKWIDLAFLLFFT